MAGLGALIGRRALIGLGAVMAVRVLAGLGGILIGIVIARLAGAEALGQFTFALAVALALALIARLGLDNCLLKEVARRLSLGAPDGLPAILAHALGWSGAVACAISSLAGAALWAGLVPEAGPGLAVLVWAVVPLTVMAVAGGYLRGLGHVALASFLDAGGLSLGTVIALPLAALIVPGDLGSVETAAVFLAVAALAAAGAALWALRDAARRGGAKPGAAGPADTAYARGNWYMMLSALAAFLTQAGSFVVVGPFLSDQALGLGRAAERLALLVSFPLTAVNPFIAPRIVRHVAQNNPAALRLLMLKACAASGLPSLPVAAALLIAPGWALALFGPGFEGAAPALQIMAVTQLVTAITAPYAMLIYMNGHERTLTAIVVAAMALGLVLLPAGAAAFGLTGFALAYGLINILKAAAILVAALRTIEGP